MGRVPLHALGLGERKNQIKRLQPHQARVCRLIASGMRVRDVARETGLHRDTVTMIVNSKPGREYVKALLDEIDERFFKARVEFFFGAMRKRK